MDAEITVLNKTHCKGCLSCDRVVQVITNAEIRRTYFTIIQEKPPTPGPLILCWECVANIVRFITFRRQVKAAHDVLLKHMVSPADITCLSKLTIIRNIIEININDSLEDNEKNQFTPNIKQENYQTEVYWTTEEETQSNVSYKQLDECNIRIESVRSVKKKEDVQPSGAGRRDEKFFKIEIVEGLNDVEENFEDDGFQHHDENDDKKIVVELEPVYNEKTEVKSKINKRKIEEEEFNDSDEEPLKKKKKTEKESKNKRKKKEDQDTKTDNKSGGKREKPAGVVSNPRVNKKLKQLNVGEGQLEMVILSWEEVEEERKKALSSVVFTRHEYRCQNCIVGFNHRFKLVNHMKKHDPSAGELVCDVCQVRCRDTHALCAHKRRHRVRWRCCTCGSTWSCAAVAADHVTRAHHAPPPTHTCTVCGHAEPTLGKLRIHIKSHAEKQKCELCGKTFRDRDALRMHLFIHKGEKEYSCPRCDKKFLFKKAMEVHLVTHNAPEQLYCHQCDMNFKNRMSYSQHMKYNLKHIDPADLKYACGSCDKKFAKARRLEEHECAVHLKITPIRCTLAGCDFACSSRPVLRTHVRMLHRNKRAQRNHVCDTCGKAYTTKRILEGHLRSHTGERPFACALCPSTFGYEAALYNHNKLVHLKAKNKSSAQRQREYRQRIAASRTPAQLIASRISDTERKRNYRLRKAANLALASGSSELTTASSFRSAGRSNDVQNSTQRQLTNQQSQSLADSSSNQIEVPDQPMDLKDLTLPLRSNAPVEMQDAAASTSATPSIVAPKSSAQRQREYRQRIAASRTPAQLIASRISETERKRNYRLRKAADLALGSGSLESTTSKMIQFYS